MSAARKRPAARPATRAAGSKEPTPKKKAAGKRPAAPKKPAPKKTPAARPARKAPVGVAGILSKVGIFSPLGAAELRRLEPYLSRTALAAGQVLFHEGDPGHDLYVIARGAVAVRIRLPGGGEREIARFSPGDFFGEMSIFDNAPRSATCAAVEESEMLSLSRDAFSEVISRHPAAALKLMYRMLNVTTQRLRGTSAFVSEMVQWGEGARRRAVTDELTGLYNRRFLEDSLGTFLAEAGEKGSPLVLVMLDLDYFRTINEAYGHAVGDEMIRAAGRVFRETLRGRDVAARYGGDEFVIVLRDTHLEEGRELMERARAGVERLDLLRGRDGPVTTVTTSMGLAAYPAHAPDLATLRAAADAALYRAKEEGRNRVVTAPLPERAAAARAPKTAIRTIGEKNRVIERIIEAFTSRHRFVVVGHQSPDDDCVSSMISTALLLHMFYRDVSLYVGGPLHERFTYLLDICRYNAIPLLGPSSPVPADLDTVVLVDTPKPSMMDAGPALREAMESPRVRRVEIDHHLGADSGYFGDEGWCLVTEASSACELVGHVLLKLQGRTALLERHQVTELFPRNLVLSILTGIIGDSNMGAYLKSRREKRYYEIFAGMFNEMLARRTTKTSNFFTMDQVFGELQRLSRSEESCFAVMASRKRVAGPLAVTALSGEDMAPLHADCDPDTIVSTARVLADRLAEESGRLGLVAYYDNPERSDLVQFRLRRAGGWKGYDLRGFLSLFSIANGGGHEGAIGFRVPRAEIADFPAYIERLCRGIEDALAAAGAASPATAGP